MTSRKKSRHRPPFMNNILDEIFHSDQPVCQIIPTSCPKTQDLFTQYRPQPKTCLDYNISQTDTKMDAGDTKIHYQHTVAEYIPGLSEPPPPPPPKKRKYFSGGPPQWEFIDEIWSQEQEKMQQHYIEVFQEYVKRTRNNHRFEMMNNHHKAIAMVGPAWFQELSPLQLATVDNLKKCILKDLADDTIINTQENIASLGLVLRPNHKHIAKALKHCCKCPVEFLLILYQLINPKRVKYSINDRLLLSAVVHLTMQETLKELHIRIPSPPRPPKEPSKVSKVKKTQKSNSPYLVRFNFVREPPKFTGIYYNKHIQRPQSPYFCYLKELRKMQQDTRTQSGQEDREIKEELILAQSIYDNLVDFKTVPKLLKPSRFTPCVNFRYKEQSMKAEMEEQEEEEKEVEEVREIQEDAPCYLEYVQPCCDAETETEELKGGCGCPPQNTCPCSLKNQLEQCSSKKVAIEENCEDCHEEVTETKTCPCEGPISEKPRIESSTVFNSSVNTERASIRAQCGSVKRKSESEESGVKNTCKHAEDLARFEWYCEYKNSKLEDKKSCCCKTKYREVVEKPFCQCEKCQEERTKKGTLFAIGGMKETGPDSVIPIIDAVLEGKPCDCLKKYEAMIEQFEKEKKKPCSCRKEAQKLVETPFCQCEKCKEDRKHKAEKFIIGGIKETESEDNVRIIEGITNERPCLCLQQFDEKADKYEEFQARKELVCSLKQQQDKYIIGGVASTPEGPMYVISGMRPPIDCACAQNARKEEEEKRMAAVMPHVPGGRIRYGITGVKETPTGNVYILDSALATEECDCMAVYQKFEEEHFPCMSVFEKYLAHTKDVYNEFMKNMLPPSSRRSSMASSAFRASVVEDVQNVNIETEQEPVENMKQSEEMPKLEEEFQPCEKEEKPKKAQMEEKFEPCQKKSKLCSTCASQGCNCGKIECKDCTCGKVVECVDCTCGPEEIEEEEVVEEEVEEEEKELKRFFIFKKILCDRKWQRKVLKKALESMADDGYPLAKLPECYKLPHFKLWMQMRCGKFWTQDDKYKYVFKSRILWRHCDVCSVRRNPTPKLPITMEEAHAMNWSQAPYVKKMTNVALEKFYRTVKQHRVNFGREFFPTTFSYEFPFTTWRDCYFAYTPSKEEDVLARFVWQKYDYKNYADMQRACG
ncbi:uncharacterized protein LOC123015290 [Tribolium madens]|uniref:uncharacterized protein LOC123015290 n=1 Tax=Tribolium madens TaxID=41895 RepID=UPI001CF71DD5|nr:uncharacterized protein LOC123015290 [Tribolium madens]